MLDRPDARFEPAPLYRLYWVKDSPRKYKALGWAGQAGLDSERSE